MQPAEAPILRKPLFYGWVVVAVAFATMAVAISARTGFSLLFPELIEEFGWDRGVTAGAFSIGFLASTAMLPLVGVMMDRFGPRIVIPFGAVLVASGFALTTLITTPLGLYLTFGLLAVNGSMAMSYIVHSMFLPKWFVRNRGLAVGVAFAGVGVGGIVLLPAMQYVIDIHGWRAACLAMAGLIFVVIIPLNAVFQRGDPADMGLSPDGGARRVRPGAEAEADVDPIVDQAWAGTNWTLKLAMRTARFWWVFVGFFCGLFVWYGIQAHQTKFLIEAGFDSTFAATALGLTALVGVIGQIAIGAMSDHVGREVAWTVSLIGFVLASLLLLELDRDPTTTTLYLIIAMQGLLGYGLAAVFGSVITEIFSGPRLASIFAFISLGGNIGASAGAWLMGLLYDLEGDYRTGFKLCAALSLLSIACIWAAAPRRVRLVERQARRRGV
jgi:sugar phosphate permease